MSDSMLVATASQTVGPFFHVGPGATTTLGTLAGPATPGERIMLAIRVLDGDGSPVPDALVEIWQADADGSYSAPAVPGSPPPAFSGFGRLGTDTDGWCGFETIAPGSVPGDGGRGQAPHVNVCVFARGLQRHLYTRVYFAGDPLLAADPVLALVPADRRPTLLAETIGTGRWQFVLRLQGPGETVFFDL